MFDKLKRIIFGKKHELIMKRKVQILMTFLSTFIVMIGVIGNIVNQINFTALILSILGLVFSFVFYLYARNSAKPEESILLLVLLSIFLLSSSWLSNGGYEGNIGYLIFVYAAFFYLMVEKQYRFLIGFIFIANYILLVLIQYYFPQFIIPYDNNFQKFFDFLIGGVLFLGFLLVALEIILESYIVEHNLQLNLNKTLSLKNSEIERNIINIENQEKRFKLFFTNSKEGMLIHHNGEIVDFNDAFLNVMGFGQDSDIIGKMCYDVIPFKRKNILVFECIDKSSDRSYDMEIVLSTGESRFLEIEVTNLKDIDKDKTLVYFRDITERKQSQSKIEEINNNLEITVKERTDSLHDLMIEFRNIFDHSPVGIFQTTKSGMIQLANKKLIEMLEYESLEELQKINIVDNIYKNHEDRKRFIDKIEFFGSIENFEVLWITKNGKEICIVINAYAVIDKNGGILYYEGTIENITQRKAQELENSKLSKAVENSPTSIVITDIKGNIEYVNKMFQISTGYSENEAIGQNPRILKSDKTNPSIYKDLWATIKKGGIWRGEFVNKKKNGEEYYERATITSISNDKNKIINFVAIKEDITQIKIAEQLFKELNDKQQILINNLPAYIYFKDTNLRYQLVNKPFSALINRPISLIIGKTDTELGLFNKFENYDLELINGTRSFIEFEDQFITSENKTMWTNTTKVIYGDILNNKSGIIGIVIDITHKKHADEEILTLNENLREANEELELTLFDRNILVHNLTDMNKELDNSKKELYELNFSLEEKVLERTSELEESLSQLIIAKEKAEESNNLKSAFLANMTHEIRTPLNEIIGFTKFISLPDINEEDRDECHLMITKSSNRLIELINNVIEISLIDTAQIILKNRTFYLNDLFSGVYLKYSTQAEIKNLELRIGLQNEDEDSQFYSDDYRLNQILEILLNNALKFTHEGYVEFGYKQENNYMRFYVQDSGIGIPENRLKTIFTKFTQSDTSLSRSYEGAGLGLSLAKGLIELMNGKIWVESTENEGSIFYFTLPIVKEET